MLVFIRAVYNPISDDIAVGNEDSVLSACCSSTCIGDLVQRFLASGDKSIWNPYRSSGSTLELIPASSNIGCAMGRRHSESKEPFPSSSSIKLYLLEQKSDKIINKHSGETRH